MPSTTIQYFDYAHLPIELQRVSKRIYDLAHEMEDMLPDGPEKSAGMRKLLEAKDCFVRANIVTKKESDIVRIKFLCTKKYRYNLGDSFNYTFEVIDSEENKKVFHEATGAVVLTSLKENLFEVGKEYYLSFVAAE